MPEHKEQAQLELRELFRDWGEGRGGLGAPSRGSVYGRAFQLMDERLVTLKDIIREGARIGIKPNVIRTRRRDMLKRTSRAEKAVKRRKKKKSPPMSTGNWSSFFNHTMTHIHPISGEQHEAWKRWINRGVEVTGAHTWKPNPPSPGDAALIADWISTYKGPGKGSKPIRGALRWLKARAK